MDVERGFVIQGIELNHFTVLHSAIVIPKCLINTRFKSNSFTDYKYGIKYCVWYSKYNLIITCCSITLCADNYIAETIQTCHPKVVHI